MAFVDADRKPPQDMTIRRDSQSCNNRPCLRVPVPFGHFIDCSGWAPRKSVQSSKERRSRLAVITQPKIELAANRFYPDLKDMSSILSEQSIQEGGRNEQGPYEMVCDGGADGFCGAGRDSGECSKKI